MRPNGTNGTLLCVALLAASAVLASWLGRQGGVRGNPRDGRQADVMALVFGEARKVVSGGLYDRADLYFHGGIQAAADNCAEQAAEGRGGALAAAAAGSAAHADEDGHAETGLVGERWDLWSRLNRRIHPTEDRHASGVRELKEVVPWLWAAAAADPHNTLAYGVGAYWLARELGRVDEALRFIGEGIRNNPDSCELEFCRGELLYLRPRGKRDPATMKAFSAALRKWTPEQFDRQEEARMCRRNILMYLATLHEQAGGHEAAKKCLRELLRMVPDHSPAIRMLGEIEAAGH